MEYLLNILRRAAWLPSLHLRDTQGPPLPVVVVRPGDDGALTVADVERRALVTAVYEPEFLTVTAGIHALNPPAMATHATVNVLTGQVRRVIGAATPDPSRMVLLDERDTEGLSGLELTAYRLTSAAGATVLVEYRTEG